jgi:hypothetical protein
MGDQPKIRNGRLSILPSSGLLQGLGWIKTDVSGATIGPTFNGQTRE